jgi:predicted O-methyltransferase YrrM
MSPQKPRYSAHYPSFSPYDIAALRQLVARLKSGFAVLEVGSWLGQGSTAVLIDAARRHQGTIYCVDTWKGNPNVERHQRIVRDYDVLGTFLENVAARGGQDVVRTLVMSSEEAARLMRDAAFDLVFIDADHSYAATRRDIADWLPKVRPGGYLAGHDCEGRVGEFGMERLTAGLSRDTIPGNDRFREVHAGVVLACHEVFGDRHQLWAETPIRAEDGTTGRSTIWFVQV